MQSNWCIKQRSQQFSHWYIKQCLHYWSFFSSLFTTIRTQTIKICFDYYSFNQSSGLFLKSNNPINSFVCNPNWDELISQRKPQQMVQTQTKNQQPSDLLSWICQTIQGPKITSYECVGVLFYWNPIVICWHTILQKQSPFHWNMIPSKDLFPFQNGTW